MRRCRRSRTASADRCARSACYAGSANGAGPWRADQAEACWSMTGAAAATTGLTMARDLAAAGFLAETLARPWPFKSLPFAFARFDFVLVLTPGFFASCCFFCWRFALAFAASFSAFFKALSVYEHYRPRYYGDYCGIKVRFSRIYHIKYSHYQVSSEYSKTPRACKCSHSPAHIFSAFYQRY